MWVRVTRGRVVIFRLFLVDSASHRNEGTMRIDLESRNHAAEHILDVLIIFFVPCPRIFLAADVSSSKSLNNV
ncbi:hypothetical protein BD769DRAFT_1524890 [Suillus cothurnatus]|nr:hypothetical protein BD769DRAFT_1524890 [Suillus cothurnatus]